MKYMVAVTFQIDTDEYADVDAESARSVRDLVTSILTGEADMPATREIKVWRIVPESERVGR